MKIIDGHFTEDVKNVCVVKTHLSERYKMISKCVNFSDEVFVHSIELYSNFDLGTVFVFKWVFLIRERHRKKLSGPVKLNE